MMSVAFDRLLEVVSDRAQVSMIILIDRDTMRVQFVDRDRDVRIAHGIALVASLRIRQPAFISQ